MTVDPRKSFRFKLMLWILSVSLVVFALIFTVCAYFSVKQVREGVYSTVKSKMDCVNLSMSEGLLCAEVASDNLIGVLGTEMYASKNETEYEFLQNFLEANKHLCGVAFGYNPELLSNPGRGHAPYVMRNKDGEGFICRDIANVNKYWTRPWYTVPAGTGMEYWAEPFQETNGNLIVSYNVPIKNAEGVLGGILAVDLDLKVVSDSLQKLSPFPKTKVYIVTPSGKYVAHPGGEKVYTELESPVKDYILHGGKEYEKYREGWENVYVFREIEPITGWIVYMEVPESDMGSNVDHMLQALIIDIIIGILLLLSVSLTVISSLTKPLEKFAQAAKEISHGNFNVELPVVKERNELFDLRQALASMKVHLDNYILKLEETTKKEARISNELEIARGIQTSMVPKVFPPDFKCGNLDVYGSMIPAQAVGGDLYDFMVSDDYFYFCIGDVSGKGVPASLFMAITRSLFRNLVSEGGKSPAEIATRLNEEIEQSNDFGMFITMFIGRIGMSTGKARFCNCGHNHPLFATPDGKIYYYDKAQTNIPLGVFESYRYEEVEADLTPETIIYLYTDGISEAEDLKQELFGDDRLLETFTAALSASGKPKDIIDNIYSTVKRHTTGAVQNDDITALCIQYKI